MALRADGALVTWGMGGGFAPADNDYVAIANGGYSHIALKTDGTVTAWHAGNSYTQNPPENSGFIAVGGGYYQWYGIKGN